MLKAPDYISQVSELSWEPTERWGQLPREVRRSRRGAKTTDHLANLRRSDPLINAWAWRDSGEELRRVEASPLARLNQQATATARCTPAAPRRTPAVPPPRHRRLSDGLRHLLTLNLACRRVSCAGWRSTAY